MSVMDCIEEEWRTSLRRERSTRVWQAIQCWALFLSWVDENATGYGEWHPMELGMDRWSSKP